MAEQRKTDRRTIYTINAIKDAFVELERETTFEKITVKALCEKAEISRATFYLHYDSLNDVLDEVIDDALLFSESASGTVIDLVDIIKSGKFEMLGANEMILPACQRMADSDKYHKLFMDASLSEYIIGRIAKHEKEHIIPELMERCGLTEEYAEMIFRFMLNGSFYVNKSLGWEKNEKWYKFQKILSVFLDAGMSAVSGECIR